MFEGKSIISFAVNYWDGPWSSRQNILSRLSRKNKVVFVSHPFYLVDVIRDLFKRELHSSGTVEENENLCIHVPSKLLPYNYRFKIIDKICSCFRRKMIRRLMKKMKMKDVILVVWNPRFVNEIGKYNEKIVLYYMFDEFSEISADPVQKNRIIDQEAMVFEKADIVVAISKILYEKAKKMHDNVIYLPNAVDFDMFHEGAKSGRTFRDIEMIPKPRIGYVGSLNKKVDFELLLYLAERNEAMSFVMIGREVDVNDSDRNMIQKLKSLDNVYFLGEKKVKELPTYINALDVCLMCYRIVAWTPYIYPLKLHEYLACGKPSIGSDIDSLLEFEGVIRIARTPEQWEEFIIEGLNEKDERLKQERIEIARKNSWEDRVEKISEAITIEMSIK